MIWKPAQRFMAVILLTTAILVGGCLPQGDSQSSSASPSSASPSPSQVATLPTVQALSPKPPNLPKLGGTATIEMVVKDVGTVTIAVDGVNAPITAGNFVDLVQRKVYDGLSFHRVVRQPEPFVVQGGDPQSKNPNFPSEQLGTGSFIDPATSQPRYIPLEITPASEAKSKDARPLYHQTFSDAGITVPPKLRHTRGAVAMARSNFPDSASSQFYIALTDLSFLDGNYAVFGYVTQGMEVVDKIQQGNRIESMKVSQGGENLKTGTKSEN